MQQNRGTGIDENIYHYDDEKRVEMVALPSIDYQITTLQLISTALFWERSMQL